MKKRFGDLPVGSRFCFRARRYEKVAPEIGRDEERGGNVFHARTEVLVETLPVCSPERGRTIVPPTSAVIDDRDLKRIERSRFPEADQQQRTLAMLREFCQPHEYSGPCFFDEVKGSVQAKGKESHGTGN